MKGDAVDRQCGFAPRRWRHRATRCAFLGLLLAVGSAPALAQRLYRWVDDQGAVHYTDSMPPEQAEKGHTELSGGGVRIREVPAAKTAEEIEREREAAREREQQARLTAQQQAADEELLQRYRSADDLIMARDGKLNAIDVAVQIAKGRVRRLQDRLAAQRAQAAERAGAGEPIDPEAAQDIAQREAALAETLAMILERDEQKRALWRESARDLERFRQLKQTTGAVAPIDGAGNWTDIERVVRCDGQRECDLLWSLAVDYVGQHATLALEHRDANLVMTAAPRHGDDISLTLSRIWSDDGGRASIFLDTQCESYNAGASACRTEARTGVLAGFKAALESAPSDPNPR